MYRLFHETFRNPLSGAHDPEWSKEAAVAEARTWKALGHHDVFDKYATEAGAFVKFGYDATDPSSTALPIPPNPKNVAAPDRFKWKWLGLRNNFE